MEHACYYLEQARAMTIESGLLVRLADKSMTTQELRQTVERNWTLLPELLQGVSSPRPSVRYGCSKVLMILSEDYPTKVYPLIDFIIDLMDNKHRILVWNSLAMIANLAGVDEKKKVDAALDKYYNLLNDGYMVTVANVVGHSGKIALAKPYLADKIAARLLEVDGISLTPHLTEECKRVIAQKAIETFDLFFDKITQKKEVISFVEKHADSPRAALRATAKNFLEKWV